MPDSVSEVVVRNFAGGVISWRADWNGGESNLTPTFDLYDWQTIDLTTCSGLGSGSELWPLIEPEAGKNHECGTNVAFDASSGRRGVYVISGGVDNLSCEYKGTQPVLPSVSEVRVYNTTPSSFNVRMDWNGGESQLVQVAGNDSKTISLAGIGLEQGVQAWLLVEPPAAPNQRAAQNVVFSASAASCAEFLVSQPARTLIWFDNVVPA